MSHELLKIAGVFSDKVLDVAAVEFDCIPQCAAQLSNKPMNVLWEHNRVGLRVVNHNWNACLLDLTNIDYWRSALPIDSLVHDAAVVVFLKLF